MGPQMVTVETGYDSFVGTEGHLLHSLLVLKGGFVQRPEQRSPCGEVCDPKPF